MARLNMCRNSCCCSPKCRKICLVTSGSLLVIVSLVFGFLWPAWSQDILNSELELREGSLNYNNWIETPIPMYLEMYLFDWKNPHDSPHNEKPSLEERGPYVFLEKHKRVNITWNSENSTITFKQIRNWEFDESKSKGSLNDLITSVNPIAVTAAYLFRDQDPLLKLFVNAMLKYTRSKVHITKTVREWLFDGYQDDLLDIINGFNSSHINIPFKRFGWLVDREGSEIYDGTFNMYTGQDDLSKMGNVRYWNYEPDVPYYFDDCAKVHGTTGELWPTNMDPFEPKMVFATDICRTVALTHDGTTDVFGIQAHKYVGDESVFDNGEKYPNMKCFCTDQDRSCKGLETGAMSVSGCKYGAPVFASFPHFYLASEKYLDDVIGLYPDKEKHQFTMTLETKTGIPLNVNARIQVSTQLDSYKEYDIYKHIPKPIMMPSFWFTQKAALTESLARDAKMALNIKEIGVYSAYGIGALGGVLLLSGIIMIYVMRA